MEDVLKATKNSIQVLTMNIFLFIAAKNLRRKRQRGVSLQVSNLKVVLCEVNDSP